MQDQPPLVSVVIPTLDRPHLLGRAIRSVLAQSYPSFEVWVIDDSAAESARQVAEGFGDQRIKYVRNTRKGANPARNLGIRLSRGRYVAFLDDDDEWLPEKLERQVGLLQRSDASTGGAFCHFRYIDPEKGFSKVVRVPGHNSLEDSLAAMGQMGTTSTIMVKKEVFDAVGAFDEGFPALQDAEMVMRISQRYRLASVPQVLVKYYATKISITKNPFNKVEAHLLLMRRYGGLLQSRRFLAYYFRVVGILLCSRGHMAKGRRYLISSLRERRDLYSVVLLLMSFAGKRVFRRVFSVFHSTSASKALAAVTKMAG